MKITEEMKKWIVEYIQKNRKEGCISLHTVFSDFNKNFRSTFKLDAKTAVDALIAEGFLKGQKAKGGFSIWLPADKGKGKRKPYLSRNKTEEDRRKMKKNQQKPAKEKTGDSLYTINTKNHKMDCDGTNLIDTARKAVQHLATLCTEDEKGRLFGCFRIEKELKDAGFETSVAHFVLFLQFMGLVRKLGKNISLSLYRYQVLDPTFFDFLVSEESVKSTLVMMYNRRLLQLEVWSSKQKIESLQSQLQERVDVTTATCDNASKQMLEKMAELAALVDELRDEKASLVDEVAQLKQKLSEQPSVDPAAIAAQMVAHAKKAL